MSEIILSSPSSALPVPKPKESITIRAGTLDDVTNIDRLQKKYSKNLAFLPTKALHGKINRNEVLVAENNGVFAGYLIGQDRYFKRDDVGIIYHLAVEETKQRGFIGAALLKAQFDRSAYGCKLYCCWCAQDLAANHFYESMGFVPLAFRAGSEAKQRIHIFWEKRIREGDTTTPWWFPSETKGGMMAADRLAFPIPPGKHWSDEMPIILPKDTQPVLLPEPIEQKPKTIRKLKKEIRTETSSRKTLGGLTFEMPKIAPAVKVKPERLKKPKIKNNPEYAAKARELKDRWLEAVNDNPNYLQSDGKYDLTRQINQTRQQVPKMLEAA